MRKATYIKAGNDIIGPGGNGGGGGDASALNSFKSRIRLDDADIEEDQGLSQQVSGSKLYYKLYQKASKYIKRTDCRIVFLEFRQCKM